MKITSYVRSFAVALVTLTACALTVTAATAATGSLTSMTSAPAKSLQARTVYLDVTYKSGGRATCSGFLIGPHTVATAGHCLRGPETGRQTPALVWATPGQFRTASGSLVRPFGYCKAKGGWSAPTVREQDYAVFDLTTCYDARGVDRRNRDIGSVTGYWPLTAATSASAMYGKSVSYLGYPNIRAVPDGRLYALTTAGTLPLLPGTLGAKNKSSLDIRIHPHVMGGGSGGALYSNIGGTWQAVGINIEGSPGTARTQYGDVSSNYSDFRVIDSTTRAYLLTGKAGKFASRM